MTKTFCSYVKERNKMRKKIESQKCSYVKAKNKKLKKPLTVRNSYRNLRKKVKVEIQKYRSND